MPEVQTDELDHPHEVKMVYEGDRKSPESLVCIYSYNGREYRLKYAFVSSLAQLYSLPYEVRENILFWAKMLNNPD